MAIESIELVGGRTALDFTNTTSGRATDAPSEHLHAYADLVEWCVRAELFGPTEARRLLAEAGQRPEDAARALGCAIRLREALYALFVAEVTRTPADPTHLATLNSVLAEGMRHRRLRPSDSTVGYCWAWAGDPDDLDWMLWPIAYSAAEILTSSEVERVKACTGETCDWLFLDVSKNRSRRWCDMGDCGNRAKARRHYHRTKGG